jgi:phosphatidate cytidylyltransferase
MSRELRLRIYSSIVMVVVVLAATAAGGLVFRILSAAIGIAIFYEWSRMCRLGENSFRGLAWGWLSIVATAANLVFGSDELAVPLLGGAVITALLPSIFGRWNLWQAGGILYAGLSAVSLAGIRADDLIGLKAMLYVFVTVWATDILAYFVGRTLGGPKLAPRISPGKTWSGALGGTLAGVAAGSALMLIDFSSLPAWTVMAGLLLSVASQAGDLFESHVKRRFGVKDSSHLIPGHGGVMDRVDGLVFACFAAFVLALATAIASGRPVESVGRLLLGF